MLKQKEETDGQKQSHLQPDCNLNYTFSKAYPKNILKFTF